MNTAANDTVFDIVDEINAAGTLIGVFSSNIGIQVRVKPDVAQTDAAKRAGLKTTKQIISPEFIKPINSAVNEARAAVIRVSQPFKFLGGVYWTSLGLVDGITERWNQNYEMWERAVDVFISKYESEVIPEARDRLGEFYDRNDYPDVRNLRRYFKLRLAKFNLTGSSVAHAEGDLRDILTEFKHEASVHLRDGLTELLEHMVERLTPEIDENGQRRRKIFRDSLVTNLHDFLDTFHHLNIGNDEDLRQHVEQVRNMLDQNRLDRDNGPDRLRNNAGLATVIRQSFDEIRQAVDSGTVRTGGRRVLR